VAAKKAAGKQPLPVLVKRVCQDPNNNRLEILLIREKQIAKLQANREIQKRVKMLLHKRRQVQALQRKGKKREQIKTLKINWHKGRRETLLGQGKKIASQWMVQDKQPNKRVRAVREIHKRQVVMRMSLVKIKRLVQAKRKLRQLQALQRKDKKREQVKTLKINWYKGKLEILLIREMLVANQWTVLSKQLKRGRVNKEVRKRQIVLGLLPGKIRSPGLDLMVPNRLLKRDRKARE
jgi:hypothetical protein